MRATVVLPVPGFPVNTRCSDSGGTGSSAFSRSFRTLMRFMRLFTSFFISSSPTSASSRAMSSSKSGFSVCAAALFSVSAEDPTALPERETGFFSANEGSPLVTNSLASSAGFDFFTPLESHIALSLSQASVIYSASAMLTSSSTAARLSRMFVSMRMKMRE